MPVIPAIPERIEPLTQDIWDAVWKTGVLWTMARLRREKRVSDSVVQIALRNNELKGIAVDWPGKKSKWRWVFYADDAQAWDPQRTPAGRGRLGRKTKPWNLREGGYEHEVAAKDVACGRALYEEQKRRRAESASKVPPRPRYEFGADVRPALWPDTL
jgi:hypothetical protein